MALVREMDFDITDFPAWRSWFDNDSPPWNVRVSSVAMVKALVQVAQNRVPEDNPPNHLQRLYEDYIQNGHQLREQGIKDLHRIILGIGEYRTCTVGASRLSLDPDKNRKPILYLASDQVPSRMQSLIERLNAILSAGKYELTEMVKLVAWFTGTFLAIHPFMDGNGRVSRALVALLLRDALGFYVRLPDILYGKGIPRYLGAIALDPVFDPEMGRLSGDPCHFAAYILDCAWLQACPRRTLTLHVVGPSKSGKRSLVNRIVELDFEDHAYLKTPTRNISFVLECDDPKIPTIPVLDETGGSYDVGRAMIILVNKVDLPKFNPFVLLRLYRDYRGRLFIPVAGASGLNVLRKSPWRMPWYTGKTLQQVLS